MEKSVVPFLYRNKMDKKTLVLKWKICYDKFQKIPDIV